MILEFHPHVFADVQQAAEAYAATSPKLGEAFLSEVSARLDKILEDPWQFPQVNGETSFRRAKLWRFPQSIVYRPWEHGVMVTLIAQVVVGNAA